MPAEANQIVTVSISTMSSILRVRLHCLIAAASTPTTHAGGDEASIVIVEV
jgi:hypothetical protein